MSKHREAGGYLSRMVFKIQGDILAAATPGIAIAFDGLSR
jgi:hypothetical protein